MQFCLGGTCEMEWSDLRIFLAVAREGTLGGAARVLSQTQPTMGRRLRALEEAVGLIRTRSRNLAKRQLTWFRRLPECRPVKEDLTFALWGLRM